VELVSGREPRELIMAVKGSSVSVFFDESGKFKDHKIVSFGGVAAYNEHFIPFAEEWGRLLHRNGLKSLSAKAVLNHRRPLSQKNRRVGIKERIEDLIPFISCIRRHLQVITTVTIDVRAFKKLPSHFFQTFGNDPVFIAFARAMLEVVGFTPDNDKIIFVCDDEEETALPFYKLYRRVKTFWPEAKNKLVGMSFADDKYLFALQAADLIAALMRLEAGRRLARVRYDYLPLSKAIMRKPDRTEQMWTVGVAFGNRAMLINLAESLKAERERMQKDVAEKSS
jgi:hypothetical protein